nr:hypothetical protein [Tanacetum cinerariifolium]
MSQEIVHIVTNYVDICDVKKSCVNDCKKCLDLKIELFKKKDFIENKTCDKLVKSYLNLEKYCISLELVTQLNQEIFQRENSGENLNAPTFNQLFEINKLKAQSQEKDTFIRKLKEIIKSLSRKDSVENIKKDIDEIETINIELEHKLNAQLQENNFVITALKNELRKLKGKNVVNTVVSKPTATPALEMFKLDIEPISARLKNNRDAHEVYIERNTEYANTLRGFIERARTHASGSKPSRNTKNNRISRPPCSNKKNKVEDHLRTVKSSLNKTNFVSEPNSNALVKHSMRNANFESIYAICNKCLFGANHDMCLVDFVNDVNVHSKSKSKRNKKRKAWKPTGKVFTNVGFKWKPAGRFFTIVGNSCPLTMITLKKIVHLKETTPKSDETSKPDIKVYSRRPKQIKSVGSNAMDVPSSSSLVNDRLSRSSFSIWTLNVQKHMTGNRSQLMNFISKFLGTVRFENDQVAKIMGYGDYQQGNVIISRVYYVKELRHNLLSVGQFYDTDLEVAFRKNACFIRNLKGVDLLSGSYDTNLYIISLDDMLKTSLVCLLSKASKTKRWLWHRRLSHLNFGILNKLAKDGLARGIPKLKFQKDHLCLACALGKSKKSSRQPKAEDANLEKLYLLYMDLCGPMCVESINGKNLGNLNAKDDIGIFVGYAPAKKAFRIYNKRTQKIIETIHVTFDELTTMASKQFDSGPGFQVMTPATSSLGLVPNIIPQQHCNPTKKDDWDTLFQPLFDEYFNPPAIVVSTFLIAVAPRAIVFMSIGQDAPFSSIPSTQD